MFANYKVKNFIALTGVLLSCGIAAAQAGDWLMSGGDVQRSGWNKDEKKLSKDNIKGMKLLWTVQTDVYPQGLHTLMDPLVVQNVPMPGGPTEMVYILGVGDTMYAIDGKTQKLAWQKKWVYEVPPPPQRPADAPAGPPRQTLPTDTKHYNFLNPAGSTGVPAIGDPDASGVRPIYVVDGGGNLHTMSDVTGEDIKPTIKIGSTSKFALQLYKDQIIIAGRGGIFSTYIDGPDTGKVTKTTGFGGGGGLWGRRGPVITSDGTVWTTTGDGQVNLTNPDSLVIGNSVIGFSKQGDSWKLKNWFTPANWAWLLKRDLDPNNTPTVFNFKGKEWMAASGKECRLFLLDPQSPGGADHSEPYFKTPLICNEAVDFQSAGSWGAVSSWEQADGTRWVLVPFWGPKHSQMKFPITNTPETKEGGVAAFKLVERGGKTMFDPVWVSRDMFRGEPPIIANGMVFTWGSGDNTAQVWPDIGLNFDSSNRVLTANHATLYVLDALTGKELWSSGDTIKTFNHFTSVTVANGKVYLSSYDGKVYCFGIS